MFELIMGLGLGLFLFLCSIMAYVTGIEHGRELSKGNAPKMDINPVKPILKAVEKHKEDKKVEELTDELNEALSYSKESALAAVKKERLG